MHLATYDLAADCIRCGHDEASMSCRGGNTGVISLKGVISRHVGGEAVLRGVYPRLYLALTGGRWFNNGSIRVIRG